MFVKTILCWIFIFICVLALFALIDYIVEKYKGSK